MEITVSDNVNNNIFIVNPLRFDAGTPFNLSHLTGPNRDVFAVPIDDGLTLRQ